MSGLWLHHLPRLSENVDVLAFARSINSGFLRRGLTEQQRLSSECEAVYLGPESRPVSIIVFDRVDESEYYLEVVWTAPSSRGKGCYERLLEWLKEYAKAKGARRISTDVHHSNAGMIRLKEAHWEKTFVRFNLAI